jgi:hypothetical protein
MDAWEREISGIALGCALGVCFWAAMWVAFI